jgi:acyl-CoA thioesterase-1
MAVGCGRDASTSGSASKGVAGGAQGPAQAGAGAQAGSTDGANVSAGPSHAAGAGVAGSPGAAQPAGPGGAAQPAGPESAAQPAGPESAAQPAGGAAQPAGTAARAATPGRPTLVFLGDSLTAGFGLAAGEAIPALIQGEIDRAGLGLRVVNAGRSGDTTAGGKARVDYYLRPEVAPRGLVVWLGGNDILRGLPVAEIESNLRAIVRRVHAFDGSLPVFLVQMRAFPNLGAEYGQAFEAVFPRVAESEGAVLLPFPMGEVAGRAGLNQDDGIHPTAEGARVIAKALWSALGPRLTPSR